MNEENYDYLKNQLKYLGFADKLNDVLKDALTANRGDFQLSLFSRFNPTRSDDPAREDRVRYAVQFKQGKDSDRYFLNGYNAVVSLAGEQEPRIRYFAADHVFRVTALEAYNLLAGRSVEKNVQVGATPESGADQAERKKVWIALDREVTDRRGSHPFRTYYEQYGFKLEDTVAKYKAEGFDGGEKAKAMLDALRKGHLIQANIPIKDELTKVFLAANPRQKSLDVQDTSGKVIPNWEIFPEMKKAMEEKRAAGRQRNDDPPVLDVEAPAQEEKKGKGVRR